LVKVTVELVNFLFCRGFMLLGGLSVFFNLFIKILKFKNLLLKSWKTFFCDFEFKKPCKNTDLAFESKSGRRVVHDLEALSFNARSRPGRVAADEGGDCHPRRATGNKI
jgi:hypothetical protein